MKNSEWRGHKGPYGANIRWTHDRYLGIEIHHCGHPTARYPYHIPGQLGTFRSLAQAQQRVEELIKESQCTT